MLRPEKMLSAWVKGRTSLARRPPFQHWRWALRFAGYKA